MTKRDRTRYSSHLVSEFPIPSRRMRAVIARREKVGFRYDHGRHPQHERGDDCAGQGSAIDRPSRRGIFALNCGSDL